MPVAARHLGVTALATVLLALSGAPMPWSTGATLAQNFSDDVRDAVDDARDAANDSSGRGRGGDRDRNDRDRDRDRDDDGGGGSSGSSNGESSGSSGDRDSSGSGSGNGGGRGNSGSDGGSGGRGGGSNGGGDDDSGGRDRGDSDSGNGNGGRSNGGNGGGSSGPGSDRGGIGGGVDVDIDIDVDPRDWGGDWGAGNRGPNRGDRRGDDRERENDEDDVDRFGPAAAPAGIGAGLGRGPDGRGKQGRTGPNRYNELIEDRITREVNIERAAVPGQSDRGGERRGFSRRLGEVAAELDDAATEALLSSGWNTPVDGDAGFANHAERVSTFVELARELGVDPRVGVMQANFGTPQENDLIDPLERLEALEEVGQGESEQADALRAEIAQRAAASNPSQSAAIEGWEIVDLDVDGNGVVNTADLEQARAGNDAGLAAE